MRKMVECFNRRSQRDGGVEGWKEVEETTGRDGARPTRWSPFTFSTTNIYHNLVPKTSDTR